MKAWQFTGTGKPLELNEVEEPTADPGEVVVDVKAAGVCHSDVAALDDEGWMALFQQGLPRTMGHESAGVISQVGEGMEHWKVGDRVGLAPMMADGTALGYGPWDGGFGPKLRATDDNLVALPDAVSFELGAMATDAGLTAYHAIMALGGAKPGMKVGEIGLTGVAESIIEFSDLGLELVVDYAGFGTTTAQGLEALAKFGTFVQVGMGSSKRP
ncbi:alcohol dehydrogenase catalytic domain-containing protein [uncultured Brachybacterium sp.]|uniref:alcohol dehydrogenase catalytic domain-containing protein n=1 Tax=uncultured Brachybacterium sp. TaxID=189680 RepID=UPI0026360660|nr:alcohol dehydrogenase catalytic domain-containing protein [uncultured Brachybacterium sp.]